jgi:hypothetical protein
MARFRVTVLDHPATLAGHMAAWNDLAAAALEPNVFYEPWMLLPAIDSFGRGRELRYVLVYADQGNAPPLLCGLFPSNAPPLQRAAVSPRQAVAAQALLSRHAARARGACARLPR